MTPVPDFVDGHAVPGMHTANPIEPVNNVKLTVNLVPDAKKALDVETGRHGDSRTDVVNRALILYAEMMRLAGTGMAAVIVDTDGRRLRLTVEVVS